MAISISAICNKNSIRVAVTWPDWGVTLTLVLSGQAGLISASHISHQGPSHHLRHWPVTGAGDSPLSHSPSIDFYFSNCSSLFINFIHFLPQTHNFKPVLNSVNEWEDNEGLWCYKKTCDGNPYWWTRIQLPALWKNIQVQKFFK